MDGKKMYVAMADKDLLLHLTAKEIFVEFAHDKSVTCMANLLNVAYINERMIDQTQMTIYSQNLQIKYHVHQ